MPLKGSKSPAEPPATVSLCKDGVMQDALTFLILFIFPCLVQNMQTIFTACIVEQQSDTLGSCCALEMQKPEMP